MMIKKERGKNGAAQVDYWRGHNLLPCTLMIFYRANLKGR